jgi:hypothetical protein
MNQQRTDTKKRAVKTYHRSDHRYLEPGCEANLNVPSLGSMFDVQ